MPLLFDFIFWIALILIFIFGALNLTTVLSVRKLDKADGLFKEKEWSDFQSQTWKARFHEVNTWAFQEGFKQNLALEFHGLLPNDAYLQLGVWLHPQNHTYLILYLHESMHWCEFVNGYDNDHSLTSSNTKDSLMLPPFPTYHIQAFSSFNLEQLFQEHQKNHRFLMGHLNCQAIAPPMSTVQLMKKSIKDQVAYIRSLPFWYLEGATWYLFRRSFMDHRSVMKQLGKS